MTKKEELVRFLEGRRIVSYNELLRLLGSENTTKHYIMELRRAGVLKYRDIIEVDGKRVVAYFVSQKGLTAYKDELRRRKQKKAELIQKINRKRKKRRLSDELL